MNIIVQNNYITLLSSYFESCKTHYITVTTVVLLIVISAQIKLFLFAT